MLANIKSSRIIGLEEMHASGYCMYYTRDCELCKEEREQYGQTVVKEDSEHGLPF